jgi:hypothetical protein
MTYNRGQPNANDPGFVSQPFLLQNTDGADDTFGIDHYPFSDGVLGGKHRSPRFVQQSEDPVTLEDEYAIYSKEDPDNNTELFYRTPTDPSDPDTGQVRQLTKNGLLNTGLLPFLSVNFDNAGTIISGFGASSVTQTATGQYTITFSTPQPDNSYFWNVRGQASTQVLGNVQSGVYATVVSTTEFRVSFRNPVNNNNININRGIVMLFRMV